MNAHRFLVGSEMQRVHVLRVHSVTVSVDEKGKRTETNDQLIDRLLITTRSAVWLRNLSRWVNLEPEEELSPA
jgi:hypothetical protein